MSCYSDKYTEKRLREVEKRLQQVYQEAHKELKEKATEYFKTFQSRYLKEYNAYMEGKYTDAEFFQWVSNQVATRGKVGSSERSDGKATH